MKISDMRIRSGKFAALAALTLGAGTMQAANLLTVTSPVAVTCNPITGPGAAASIVVQPVTPLTGTATIAVTVTQPGHGLTVTAPSAQTLNATTALTLTYTVNASSSTCSGASIGPVTIQFNQGGTADATSTANVSITSPLVPSPSSLALTCVKSGSNYTVGASQTESVTSAVSGGTAFTIDNASGSAPPAWVSLSSLLGGTATSTPVTFTVSPAAGCGGFALGSVHTGTINLASSGVTDKAITVTLTILGPNPLTGTLSSSSMTYVKNSGTPAAVTLSVTSSPTGLYFTVNTATLPIWLTVNTTAGTAPSNVVFSSTSICDTLAPGTYTATVQYAVSGDAPASVTISLLITNKPSTLSVVGSTTQNLSWTLGTPIPTASLTLVSSDSPIPYTAVGGGTLAPIIPASEQSGLAYDFGTTIGMTFSPLLFQSASPGTVLTGTVTITSGNPVSTIVVTINITVATPGATLTGLTPSSLPTAAAGSVFQITLTGTNFVVSTDPTQKTRVGILGTANAVNLDTNFSSVVTNPSNITLTITVPTTADASLPFAPGGAGGTVVIAVCNPSGASTCTMTGQQTLTISPGPIIQAITSASSFTEVAPGTNPTTSAYDMLSVFGSDFCASGGTGCGSTTILTGTLDAASRYKTSLTPDTGSTPRNLTASFYVHGTGGAFIASAPLLFATNSQINLLVPAAVNSHVGSGTVDLVVNFGTAAMPATETVAGTSAIHTLNIAATDPGVFTEGADGQGNAAVLAANYAPITQASPAGMHLTAGNSDTVLLYVSGLGLPNSTAADGTGGSDSAPTDCISTANYQSALAAASGLTLTSIDGAILQSSLIDPSRLPPCMATSSGTPTTIPAITIGGVAVPANHIKYAGFVAGSVAGLYQINVQLPGTTGNYTTSTGASITNVTTEVALPVVVTSQGASSQAGVNIWVQPELLLTAPTALSGTVGVAWSGSNNTVTAADGVSPYTYAVTAGTMPAGLSLTSGGAIVGTPFAGTGGQYQITVTATDSSPVPITGNVTFTLTVAADLYLTGNPSGNLSPGLASGAPYADVTQVTAAGGAIPYTYGINVTPPSGGLASDITVDSSGNVSVGASAVTGTYNVTVTASDSSSTPLTGSYSFTITLG
jgi:Putative Ig domain